MKKLNSIKMDLADRVIRGDFGNGEERKRNSGSIFEFFQNRFNEQSGCIGRHNPFYYR